MNLPAVAMDGTYPRPPRLENPACRNVDPELMMPDGRDQPGVTVAKGVCARCPARTRAACQDYALAWPGPGWGVWGGLSPAEIEARKLTGRRYTQEIRTHDYSGYAKECRCDVCKAAKAKYERDKRAARRTEARRG